MALPGSFFLAAIGAVSFSVPALAAPDLPANLGLGLRRVVENYQQGKTPLQLNGAASRNLQIDTAQRVMVNIHLDGAKPIEEMAAHLRAMGLEITATDPHWRHGVISARLPLAQAIATATSTGVRSVLLAPRPRRRVGSVTAQSSMVERADKVNRPGSVTPQGILGRGVTVGILSDSFDNSSAAPRAIVGVNSGDLPGVGNPNGYTDPVVILEEGLDPGVVVDEGRGMAEIVHDIAPAAKICFATAGTSQAAMAQSIRRLRTDPQALCDIIVDDWYFFEEPFFSDGEIGLAVEDVATSNVLAGKKVSYFSAAGNSGNNGYAADFRRLTPAQAMTAQGPVHLLSVPPGFYTGGVHNFGSASNPVIAMPVTTDSFGEPTIVFQWDDPFDAGAVTTDYNLFVFAANGNYVSTISSTENNFAIDEPVEIVDLQADTTYYLVIGLDSAAPPVAKHLRLLSIDGTPISSNYISYSAPTIVGHPVAADAGAVGAYLYNDAVDRNPNYNSTGQNPPPRPYRPVLESFTSNGGALPIYFDSLGNRLATPQIRLKPDFSAADGVDTSFFPGPDADSDHDNFPNFYGTSASAPTAAGIAALMLEAAGGPGHLTQAQIRTKLKQTAFAHDIDPFSCRATAKSGQTVVTVTGTGNDTNQSSASSSFFAVTFTGSAATLSQLQIDLTNVGLAFDIDPTNGTPFVRGPSSAGVVMTPSLSANRRVLTVNFGTSFHAGQAVRFGIDRDYAAAGFGGNSADFLAGAAIIATLSTGSTLVGGFANRFGHSFTFADGYGLLDAQAAVESIVGKAPVTNGVPRNISTRGYVGTGNEALIGGFIIRDNAKKVVLRALGPSLAAAGVQGVLIDPTLDLYNANGTLLAHNNNWRDSPTAASEIYASGLSPANIRESALIRTLPAANYTAIVRGLQNKTGIGLVEVYDVDAASSTAQLANVSSRGLVKTGASVMIGGFIVAGARPANVVVRALGPSLASAGISNYLPDPILELRNGNGALILTNDNWQQDSLQVTQIFDDGLAPTNALESAVAVSLQAGNYTAVVRGARGSTGIGLVEMYNIR